MTDLDACRALLANGSRTFLAASYLLPRDVRDSACALYAWCRVADDAIDHAVGADAGAERDADGDGRNRAAAMHLAHAALQARLDAIYAGDKSLGAAGAVDRAFAAVVHRHAIPRALPDALLQGFAWDAEGRRCSSFADLLAYAARVAGSVGAMMSLVMGARSVEALARACDLGVAMQLSNVARDVGEDARAGRVYLPLDWLREAGIDADAWLAAPKFAPALGGVVQRLLDEAETLYARAAGGIAELPPGCRVGIEAARLLYAEIGREVARRGGDSVERRAVVGARRKAALLARATVARARRVRAAGGAAALTQTQHLVDAAVAQRPRAPMTMTPASASASNGRVVWLIDLFERLERADRMPHAGVSSPT